MKENKIAKIVVGLPIEGPFDYFIPSQLRGKTKIGQRCWVIFRNKKMLGYIVALADESKIRKLNPLLSLIDQEPILDENLLRLTKETAQYYCCTWPEAIEAALPVSLRKARSVNLTPRIKCSVQKPFIKKPEILLLRDDSKNRRIDFYLDYISKTLKQNLGVIILSPQMHTVLALQKIIVDVIKIEVAILHSRQTPINNLRQWQSLKEGSAKIAIGTCQAIFAPLRDLGLIIVDEEDSQNYKQDQTPRYHARQVALMRAQIYKSGVILASSTPCLESYYQAKTKNRKIKLVYFKDKIDSQAFEIKLVDMRQANLPKKRPTLSLYLENEVRKALHNNGKVILFLNRRGFATYSFCQHCGFVLKCNRCNRSLTYKFDAKILVCHYCNYKLKPPEICPQCQNSYVRFWGLGTEKLESEVHRFFSQARIKRWDTDNPYPDQEFDILIATQLILRLYQTGFAANLLGVVSADLSLNRVDFRSSEKTFALLYRLISLAKEKVVIQTALPSHYCFNAIAKRDYDYFYRQELKSRKELNLPPFTHLADVNLRGKDEEKVKATSISLFEMLKSKPKQIHIFSPIAKIPSKLRGNFYYQILLKSESISALSKFIKRFILPLKYSGIIITVDVDPV